MPSTLRTGRRRRTRSNLMHLDLCFTNFIQPFFIHESPPPSPASPSSSPLHHHHRHIDHNRPSPSTTTATTSIIKNFNTLCDHISTAEPEPEPEPEPADFATAFASQRFFFSSPGQSNSIVESTAPSSSSSLSSLSSSSLTATAPPPPDASSAAANNNVGRNKLVLFDGSVAVPTYSPDPYLDFRRSMQEMVEARPEVMMDVKSNLDVLQELLLCYLALNPKSTHKFILGAFADLLATLMALSSSSSSCSCSLPSPPLPPQENPDLDDMAGGGGGGC